jgi:carboxymethylenebutenolidase
MKFVRLICMVSLVAVATSALAATGKAVSYQSGDEKIEGVLYTPSGTGPFPAIVVIHEWWGLTDWVKEQASRYADEGYVALAVDLYRGKVTNNPDMAHELARGLPDDRAARDLRAAVAFLKSQANVRKNKIGSIGWCMGGGFSLQTAIEVPDLAATVVNYGHLATEDATLKKINAPILGIFGGQDRGISVSDAREFEAAMKKLGKSAEIVVYPEAGHGFQNSTNKNAYRPDDTADAQKRIAAFFAAKLK